MTLCKVAKKSLLPLHVFTVPPEAKTETAGSHLLVWEKRRRRYRENFRDSLRTPTLSMRILHA